MFPGQDQNLLMDQKPLYPQQQYAAPPSHNTAGGFAAMQDAGYHGIGAVAGPRPGFPMIRMQPRPVLRPPGSVPNQPNALRLQLQHRLQAQQVKDALTAINQQRQIEKFPSMSFYTIMPVYLQTILTLHFIDI